MVSLVCSFFFFIWLVVTIEAAVCHIFHSIGWDLVVADETDCVSSFHVPIFEPLGQPPKFVYCQDVPGSCVIWVPEKLLVVQVRVGFVVMD